MSRLLPLGDLTSSESDGGAELVADSELSCVFDTFTYSNILLKVRASHRSTCVRITDLTMFVTASEADRTSHRPLDSLIDHRIHPHNSSIQTWHQARP